MNIGKFVLNIVLAFIVYGVLYTVGGMMFMGAMEPGMAAMNPPEEIMMPTMAYHLVQTIVVVWLFDKAVGSGDLKAGAMFGFMVGLYLMATDSVWFTSVKDFPQDARVVMSGMNIVIGAIVGVFLAFMQGKGMGSSGGAAE
jgi:hypothetical protein